MSFLLGRDSCRSFARRDLDASSKQAKNAGHLEVEDQSGFAKMSDTVNSMAQLAAPESRIYYQLKVNAYPLDRE